jgi:hypothetical protein
VKRRKPSAPQVPAEVTIPAPPRRAIPGVPLLVALALLLAFLAGLGDSVTFDEGVHIVSGTTALRDGDFRLNPEHPPLVKLWAALPLAVGGTPGPGPGTPGWREGDTYGLAQEWLTGQVDGERVVRTARLPMLAVLAGFLWAVFSSVHAVLGRNAAFLALFAASLDPLVLGHGRLVTTDLAAALAIQVTLVAFAGFLEKPNLAKGALFLLAIGAAGVTKYSWVVAVPALAGMGLAWALRNDSRDALPGGSGPVPGALGHRRARRLALLGGLAVGAAAAVFVAAWAVYGFRYEPYRGDDAPTALLRRDSNADGRFAENREQGWKIVQEDWATGNRRQGTLPRVVELARTHRVLPEPYLYGLSYVDKWSRHRIAYFRGQLSTEGWPSYFPVAFLVKTPVVTLVLLGLGSWALLRRRIAVEPAGRFLLLGMSVFSVTWLAISVSGGLNIGLRHLLPVYPLLFLVAGAAAAFAAAPRGRLFVGGLAALLAVETLSAFPHHLGFFNRLSGGAAEGRAWLADSNLDWGQDLLRLRDYCRERGIDGVHLAVHPSTPMPRSFRPQFVLAAPPGSRLSPLVPGTYVVSVNMLLGLSEPMARDEVWGDPGFLENARRAVGWASSPPDAGVPAELLARARADVEVLRHARLVNRLRSRPEDGRIGTSLLVFELTAEDLRSLSVF